MIKCSAGTAKVLGIKELKTDAPPTTAYLMMGERCSYDCAFCPQARNSSSRADLLSRVTWPGFAREQVIDGIVQAFNSGEIKRTCFQVVEAKNALAQTKQFLLDLHAKAPIPVCVSCSAGGMDTVVELINQGADHVSIALDAACERVFAENKGGSWQTKLGLIEEAAASFPGRIATHLIVGLGETEEEMLRTIQLMMDWKVTVALFAFTPVKGTRLENTHPPSLDHYRRIQAGRYLMLKGICRFEDMAFVDGRLTSFGPAECMKALADGEAFRTSGCPDCNRPYYNEKPGGTMYNFPRPLAVDECRQALRELNLGFIPVEKEGV